MSDEKKIPAQGPDEEAKEILAEMEADHKLKGDIKPPEKQPEPVVTPPVVPPAPVPVVPAAVVPPEDSGESGDNKELLPRTPFLPYAKHKKILEKRDEEIATLTAKVEALTKVPPTQQQGADLANSLKGFVEKYGADNEYVNDLVDLIIGQVKLPKETLDKLEKVTSEAEARDNESMQIQGFNNEWDATLAPALTELAPDLDGKTIKTIKEKIMEMAFEPDPSNPSVLRYGTTPLKDLFLIAKNNNFITIPQSKRSAESPKGGASRGGGLDLTHELTGEQIGNLSDEDFDIYSANMAKQSRPTIRSSK